MALFTVSMEDRNTFFSKNSVSHTQWREESIMARAGHRNSMALSRVSSDKSSREISQSNSASTTEAGKAGEMVQQDRLPAISAEVEPQPASVAEPTWPHGIQPYKALFGSIFLQLNSWGQVCISPSTFFGFALIICR